MGLNCAVYNSCGFSHGMGEGKNTQQLSGPKNPAKVNKEVLVGGVGGVLDAITLRHICNS